MGGWMPVPCRLPKPSVLNLCIRDVVFQVVRVRFLPGCRLRSLPSDHTHTAVHPRLGRRFSLRRHPPLPDRQNQRRDLAYIAPVGRAGCSLRTVQYMRFRNKRRPHKSRLRIRRRNGTTKGTTTSKSDCYTYGPPSTGYRRCTRCNTSRSRDRSRRDRSRAPALPRTGRGHHSEPSQRDARHHMTRFRTGFRRRSVGNCRPRRTGHPDRS